MNTRRGLHPGRRDGLTGQYEVPAKEAENPRIFDKREALMTCSGTPSRRYGLQKIYVDKGDVRDELI